MQKAKEMDMFPLFSKSGVTLPWQENILCNFSCAQQSGRFMLTSILQSYIIVFDNHFGSNFIQVRGHPSVIKLVQTRGGGECPGPANVFNRPFRLFKKLLPSFSPEAILELESVSGHLL